MIDDHIDIETQPPWRSRWPDWWPWLPEATTQRLHDNGDHRWCPSRVMFWEAYQVPEGDGLIYEAQGHYEDERHGDDVWLHGNSAGAILDSLIVTMPTFQHHFLVSHGPGQARHLCPDPEGWLA
jgi:hypothetical protein